LIINHHLLSHKNTTLEKIIGIKKNGVKPANRVIAQLKEIRISQLVRDQINSILDKIIGIQNYHLKPLNRVIVQLKNFDGREDFSLVGI
jgi:hypothetical protein